MEPSPPHSRYRTQRRVIVVTALVLLASSLALGIGFWVKAPFSQASVARDIERSGLRFEAATFSARWLPPGFEATDVKIIDPAASIATPLLTAKHVDVSGSYWGLLRKNRLIPKVKLTGARATVSLRGEHFWNRQSSGNHVAVSEMYIENSALDIASGASQSDLLRFRVSQLTFRHLGGGGSMPFSIAITNPTPHGEIHANGSLGPWNSSDRFATPVSGSFTFADVDLTVDDGISGILNSQGKFAGVLRSIACTGSADVPRFKATRSSPGVHVTTEFSALVDAKNGDTILKQVAAQFNQTKVAAYGQLTSIATENGKTIELSVSVRQGRVEDLLTLFTANEPSMIGAISLDARVRIPPGPRDFLTRLALEGDADIERGRFTKPETQQTIDRLSASAEGEKKAQLDDHPPHVEAHVKGHVRDAEGVARLSSILFHVPGVEGKMTGTLALHTKHVNLEGSIATAGKLSDTTSGLKSIFLKVVSPVWKKQANVEIVPFHISGTASHPTLRLEFHH